MKHRWIVRGGLALIVLGILAARLFQNKISRGYYAVPVTNECDSHLRGYAAVGDLVLHISNDGQVKINDERVSAAKFGVIISDIFQARNQRVLFVDAADEVEFETIARFMDAANSSGKGVRFIIVTNKSRQACLTKWASIPGAY